MDKQITVWLGAVLLLAVPNCSEAEVIPTYFEEDGTLDLRPSVTGFIYIIQWKFNGNLMAEWDMHEDMYDLYDLYGKYKDCTTLNITTGQLVITNMKKDNVGLYTVEINGKVPDQSYDVKWITRVTKPTVVFRPLTCGPDSERYTVTCDVEERGSLSDAEPIQFRWKIGEKDWKTMAKDIVITNNQTKDESIKTIACQMKNPVSQEDSEAKVNPMYKEEPKEKPLFKVKPEVWKVHLRLSLHAAFWVFIACMLLILIERLSR